MNDMKTLLALLVPAAVVLTPILVRAEEQHPEGTRSDAPPGFGVPHPDRPTRWRLAADGPRVRVGVAELKLDLAARRWGLVIALPL